MSVRAFARVGLLATIAVVTVACGGGSIGGNGAGAGGGSGESGGTGGGGASGAGGDRDTGDAAMTDGAAPDGETPEGGTPTNANCLQIRMCVAACADPACVQRCLDLGSPAGRMLFEQLQSCSKTACPNQQDRTCRCESECIFPGSCTDLQDMCADGVTDPACQMCA